MVRRAILEEFNFNIILFGKCNLLCECTVLYWTVFCKITLVYSVHVLYLTTLACTYCSVLTDTVQEKYLHVLPSPVLEYRVFDSSHYITVCSREMQTVNTKKIERFLMATNLAPPATANNLQSRGLKWIVCHRTEKGRTLLIRATQNSILQLSVIQCTELQCIVMQYMLV